MFIRFTTLARAEDTGRNVGILVAGHTLRDEGDISVEEHRELRLRLKWFNDNLHIPPIYGDPKNRRALSWFKDGATRPIQYMWDRNSTLSGCDQGMQRKAGAAENSGVYTQ